MEETPEVLFFNGLDAASGEYLLPPMTPAQLSKLAQGGSFSSDEIAELRSRVFTLKNPGHAGVEADARDLAATGWGVIFAHDADPAVHAALAPLLALRRGQAGERYREYRGVEGYRPGESKGDFLARHGMGPGPANPDKVPYYLLIAGDPEAIPFRFQYQLDLQYAVGRIHFDTAEEYASYARSVVAAEAGLALPPRAVFFGAANPGDLATQLSAAGLTVPLAERIRQKQPDWQAAARKAGAALPTWEVETLVGETATRQRLSDLLNGPEAPALLFIAGHGAGFPSGHPLQAARQGALVCQDWPGPLEWRRALREDFYFSADQLGDEASLPGRLAFFFACYGAGTPGQDDFAARLSGGGSGRGRLAPFDFVAALPKRMLSLPRGGALAVVGHIERAWSTSFLWGEAGLQLQVFHDCFERLIQGGYPLGYALEVFNNRYAELAADLAFELDQIHNFGKIPNDRRLAGMWTANNDARNYIILGDPAVRLRLGDPDFKLAS